jgi:hypothetical protein
MGAAGLQTANSGLDAGGGDDGRAAQQGLLVVAFDGANLVEPRVRCLLRRVGPLSLDGQRPQEIVVVNGRQIGRIAVASSEVADLSAVVEIERKLGVVFQPGVEPR